MLAVHAMSAGTEAVLYFIMFVAFIVATLVAWFQPPRAIWAALISVGLTMFSLVLFWNALALS